MVLVYFLSTLRHGMHDLKVWPGVEADGKMPTSTPGKTTATEDQMNRLAKLSKKHHKGQMLKVDWLDRLTFREIEMINEDADEVDYVCTNPEIVKLPEPEILLDNLVEIKHHKLVRSIRSGTVSRDLKPNANTRDHLNQIVSYPPTKVLTSEEKDLVWQFRFY
ncbi:predicted protein [Nematostella vectensis]|uniref:C2 PI3K-type domain-containing protein n=1 Tax=Nematostella vectensis TaxID=45351 RepID=A7T8J7_NEMVE|nr:predicted protein [Nematostella vectensis]|eukprot:XP_001619788.1 hypothetical protein NEMVEDRAFT_v1g223824 [Nematostella vectensis]